MELKVGSRLKCKKTSAEFMIVKPGEGILTNADEELILSSAENTTEQETNIEGPGNVLGKRYESKSGIIVLCTKPGAGIIHCDGIPMNEVKPKRLPSSD
tara:strand:+ start:4660 stop:4956 length:297 start_codon:yes stop_codon:yes gene_type:complete